MNYDIEYKSAFDCVLVTATGVSDPKLHGEKYVRLFEKPAWQFGSRVLFDFRASVIRDVTPEPVRTAADRFGGLCSRYGASRIASVMPDDSSYAFAHMFAKVLRYSHNIDFDAFMDIEEAKAWLHPPE